MLDSVSGNRRSAATLLRVLAIVAGAAVVLGVAYVTVNPQSGPTVSARQAAPPVTAFVSQPIELGRGRASLAAGGAGLWVRASRPPAARAG